MKFEYFPDFDPHRAHEGESLVWDPIDGRLRAAHPDEKFRFICETGKAHGKGPFIGGVNIGQGWGIFCSWTVSKNVWYTFFNIQELKSISQYKIQLDCTEKVLRGLLTGCC